MRIDRDGSSSTLLLLLPCFVFMIISHNVPCSSAAAAANPLLFNCTSREEYTPNSAFESNLKLLLSSISSNTTPLSKGFYNYSVGTEETNKVYGLALCRGNISLDVCHTCLEKATTDVIYFCPNKRDAIIWYEYCQLRYSSDMFFTQMVYPADQFPPRNVCQHNAIDPTNFYLIENMLMANIIDEAASSSEHRFATGEITINGIGDVFGLVECSPYITRNHCNICLFNAMDDLLKCSSREGGMVLGRSCNLMLQVSPFKGLKGRIDKHIYFVIPAAVLLVLLLAGYCGFYLWTRKKRKERQEDEEVRRNMLQGDEMDDFSELPFIDFDIVKVATGNFSDSNKLGEGGFGTVYKGTLPDGKEIAVKRLSKRSHQGLEEFKNEVILIAKLQHRNLVRLLGCGIDGEEKLLIYEFMPNGSLDFLIFDPIKRSQLHWATRYQIIDGIGRGLLYLHEGSRLKIIHRDIKTSNVLLDAEMNAKISDFGMARIFFEDQNNANTRRVVGTYGYMSPEYAMEGTFSMKSDVFSFGVILLEIISGKRNNSYLMEYGQTLLAHVWRLWNEGKVLDFVDPWLISPSSRTEILRCMHIGILCVQREVADRPTMSNVVVMLGSDSSDLPQPKEPAFTLGRVVVKTDQSTRVICSVNEATISNDIPR